MQEDFDIQAALLQFQKAGLEDSAAAPLVVEKAYNKDDFFDELSCDALEKSAAASALGACLCVCLFLHTQDRIAIRICA